MAIYGAGIRSAVIEVNLNGAARKPQVPHPRGRGSAVVRLASAVAIMNLAEIPVLFPGFQKESHGSAGH